MDKKTECSKWPYFNFEIAKGKPKQNSSKLSLAEPSRAKQLIPHYHNTVPPPC